MGVLAATDGVAAQTSAPAADNQSSLYTLDGWGGVHPVGASPALATSAYWQGWDIARGLTVTAGGGGYVLDGWGALHPVGSAAPVTPGAYWQGWDIARSLAVNTAGSGGYVVDGWGGVHPFGGAPSVSFSAYWRGWDIARGIVAWTGGTDGNPGGWVLDGWGGVHAYGSAPPLNASAYWQGWDIARGIAGGGSSAGGSSPPSSHVPLPPAPAPSTGGLCGAPSNPWKYTLCGGTLVYNPPSNFCTYFRCIPSFWKQTNGYVDRCVDGMYSHSGGRSGACSSHGGEHRPLYAS